MSTPIHSYNFLPWELLLRYFCRLYVMPCLGVNCGTCGIIPALQCVSVILTDVQCCFPGSQDVTVALRSNYNHSYIFFM